MSEQKLNAEHEAELAWDALTNSLSSGYPDDEKEATLKAINLVRSHVQMAKVLCQAEFSGPVSAEAVATVAVAIGQALQSGQDVVT